MWSLLFTYPFLSIPNLESNDWEVLLHFFTEKSSEGVPSSYPIIFCQFLDDNFNMEFSVLLILNGNNSLKVIICDDDIGMKCGYIWMSQLLMCLNY